MVVVVIGDSYEVAIDDCHGWWRGCSGGFAVVADDD